ncbi:hypothetical protein A966_02661 [Brachyspira hampsonii 30446]|uniref:Uncharacterized protein n=3 Tax=Brachyspira hampsonii TaxID=1287055 RepID=A0A2U4EXK3_9SPIR|nr:DUF5682 family protein [Brachyspira hampsonii]EKV57995.1 hypothetical protein A966_02661 [Brachyspira hampsonii 30446]MBW5395145.1 hypothetical protein [Brachyspira hampsonii]OEJ16681.1 hypothetical protein A9495_08780 [Brachyspira hampsonii]
MKKTNSSIKDNNNFDECFEESIKDNVIFFPIRHHSPACSYHLKKIFESFKPDAVLIEGPNDCNDLMKYMIEEDTKAPFCIYSSYVDGNNEKYRCYYPFLDYSPEFTAIRESLKNNIHCCFIDMNYAFMIENSIDNSEHEKESNNNQENSEEVNNNTDAKRKKLVSIYDNDDNRFNVNAYTVELTKKAGLRSFAELWERDFEINGIHKESKDFIRSVYALGYYMRLIEDEDFETRNREYVMALNVKEALEKYNRVLVVTGSFHTKGIIDKLKEDEKDNKKLNKEYKRLKKYIISNTANYLIPYSFEDADARRGYRAGIEFPAFYNLVYKELENYINQNNTGNIGNMYLDVVMSFIIKASNIDRYNHNVSIPDCINAYYMAVNLAKLRGKYSAGVYELIDAAKSAFVKGDISLENTSNLDLMLKLLSGMSNGHVSSKSIVPPVVIDFRNKCKEYKIKTNKTEEIESALDIVKNRSHFEKSKFFHKMQFLDTGFCKLERGPDYVNKINKNLAREIWKYEYKTAVDSVLIDKSVYGVTIEELASNLIVEKLNSRIGAAEVSKLLIEANVMGIYSFFTDNYNKIEETILSDNNFVSLCSCLNNLSYLANMEAINNNLSIERESLFCNYDIMSVIESLAKQVFTIAVINMDSIKNLPEEEALKNSHYIKNLYSFTLENPNWCDIDIFNNKIDSMLDNTFGSSHIYAVCLALKYKSGRLTADEFSHIISSFMESSDIESSSYFLNGILSAARDILFINENIIESIDLAIKKLDEDKFLEILPNFRYAFANLSPIEIERLSYIIADKYNISKNKILIDVNLPIEEIQLASKIDNEVFDLMIKTL